MKNPYQNPSRDPAKLGERASQVKTIARRKIALGLIATPFVCALPIYYWAFNYAGSWFASTDLPPDRRGFSLVFAYAMLMFCVTVFSFFPAIILLWMDRFYPIITGILAIIFMVLMLPAVVLAYGLLSCYIQFS